MAATGDAAAATPKVRAVDSGPVSWTIPVGQCPNLAAYESLAGDGVHVLKSTSSTSKGITTIRFDDHAEGTATDQAGNEYHWTYDNTSASSNSLNEPLVFTGTMHDRFRLDGDGPIHLINGFYGSIIDDQLAGTFDITETTGYGDALGGCDPL